MILMFDGEPIFGPRGPAGPDGNPIGTVISYMGITPPKDYLVCDGAEYDISQYSELANFFEAQFGASNHFGGDGVSTFAVPDLRNLFLRGFHGEADEQLSGEIGEKQSATEHVGIWIMNSDGRMYSTKSGTSSAVIQANVDKVVRTGDRGSTEFTPTRVYNEPSLSYSLFTSRPVNAAVLYCIKAVTSEGLQSGNDEIYSTEEVRIGTWIDGKPIYRKVFSVLSPSTTNGHISVTDTLDDIDCVISLNGIMRNTGGNKIAQIQLPAVSGTGLRYNETDKCIDMNVLNSSQVNAQTMIIFEYTKTTD